MLVGSQTARFNTAPCPAGYSLVHAERAIEFAAGYGFVLDEWQQEVVKAWLRTRPDGRWCASTWAVSVPRQNGKNGGLEVVELYGMVALNLKFLHTSHLLGSARKAFKRLLHFFGQKVNDPNAQFPELNALVKEIRKTNGQEAIELYNGGLIELGARTGGAGRGSSFDVLVIDEAQEYEEDEQEALEPTVSASPSGDPITIFMGTPPADLSERGKPFVRIRNAAISGRDKRAAWVEHSPQGDVDKMSEVELARFVADRKNWAEANPALGIRITLETVEGEFHKWAARSFARERLNMWPTPTDVGAPAFKKEQLDALEIENPSADWPVAAYAVDMNHERTKVTIAVASFGAADKVHLELAADTAFDDDGTEALVEWLWSRAKRIKPVVIDAFSPARDVLEVKLKRKGMKVFILGANEYAQACSLLELAVLRDKSITHFGQEHLTTSLLSVSKKPMKNYPSSFTWLKADIQFDISPTVAVTCALFGALKFARKSTAGAGEKKRGAIVF